LLYSLLYLFGFSLTLDDLKSFRQLGSKTPGHPEYEYSQHAGVEATTGPLGQGFANAVGMAIAEAHLAAVYNRAQTIVDHYTYCLAGDGDLMEGISQEALSLAGELKPQRSGTMSAQYREDQLAMRTGCIQHGIGDRTEACTLLRYGRQDIQEVPGRSSQPRACDGETVSSLLLHWSLSSA
jgi:hypothetical protein